MKITYVDELPSKPLVEALVEIKWGQQTEPDRAYPILLGRLYERLREKYPDMVDLPIVQVPSDMTVHVARHQFRSKNKWPLVQVGPGVVTLNDTERYRWENFRPQVLELHPKVRESHPYPDVLSITSLKLEYIDAIEFDFKAGDVRSFLKDKLHVSVALPPELFHEQPVQNQPIHTLVELGFPTTVPKGRIQLTASTGRREDGPAVILRTSVLSLDADAQEGWDDFAPWLDAAHAVIRHWFFVLIQGDLLKEFMKA